MSSPIAKLEQDLRDKPRRWLVTGAAGFVGSHLVERLLGLGQAVVGLDDFSTGHRENLTSVRSTVGETAWEAFTLIEGDIRDRDACKTACEGIEHVLHQAALGSVPRSIKDPAATHSVNVDGFINMLEAARAEGCASFVYASSSSVYGDHPDLPKREPAVGNPLSPYAASKRCNEIYASAWREAYGSKIYGLRYFNVVGARQDPNGAYAAVVPRWASALIAGERPVLYGDGKTSRDFCPVRNVTQANLLAACASEHPGGVFNVALGGRMTLIELFEALRAALSELGAPCADIEFERADFRPGDVRHSQAETNALRELGYEPEQDLASGLRETAKWFWEASRRSP